MKPREHKPVELVELEEWWEVLGNKLTGHYQDYGISGNMEGLRRYYSRILRLAYKWINRWSRESGCNWKQFHHCQEYNPLPKPKIYHLTYTLSSH